MRLVLLICFLATVLARDIPEGVDRITDIAFQSDPTNTRYHYICVGSKLLRGNAYLFIDAEGSLAGLNATKQIVAFQTISFNNAPSAGELAKLEELLCRRDFENIMTSMDQYCQTYYEEFDTAFTEKCTYGQLYSGA
jgi:hypothetical protein